tara:strand:- start:387 stop:1172 length:786 start_codon:yes stop_codon:yes gene_type:complete
MAITNLDSLQRQQEMNDRLRASANRLNPLFGQQQQGSSMSIPMGGFMAENKMGGRSAINIYRAPPPALTPEQQREKMFEDRANQYQQEMAEFNLSQREAELEELSRDRRIQEGKDRNAAHQIKNRYYMLDGKPVSAEEMKAASGKYLQEYTTPQEVTPEQKRTNSIRQSLEQYQQNPMQFLLGGGQNVGELLSYLNTANQLFKATGQEGNFMDSLFGSFQKSQGNVPRQSLQNKDDVRAFHAQSLAKREEAKRKSPSSRIR